MHTAATRVIFGIAAIGLAINSVPLAPPAAAVAPPNAACPDEPHYPPNIDPNLRLEPPRPDSKAGSQTISIAAWPGATVTVTWVVDGKTYTKSVTAGEDGSAILTLEPVGDNQTITWEAEGYLPGCGNIIKGFETILNKILSKYTVPAKAAAVAGGSKYRTYVSSDPNVQKAEGWYGQLAFCPGPFKFRIQKQKKQVRRLGSGRTKVRITWITLATKYKTNRQNGLWHYRTVNLKKGTYRSVIFGKCGLTGSTTKAVSLKR